MSARIAPPTGPRRYNTPLDDVMCDFESAVARLEGLDPITVEAVRLRVARLHDCRRCRAVRYEVARNDGFDDELSARIDTYETSDLAPDLVAALRLVDAVLLTPTAVHPGLRADLAEHYSPAQVAQLLLVIARFSVNKALVALRVDAPLEDGTTLLTVLPDGSNALARPV